MLLRMAWRNLWRNPRRTLITVSSVTVGLAAILVFFGFMDGMNIQTLENNIRGETGHIKVYRKGYFDNPRVSLLIRDPKRVVGRIRGLPHVERVLERVEASGLIAAEAKSAGARILGIDLEREKGVTNYWRYVREGRYLLGKGEVLVGRGLARMLRVGVGDGLAIILQAADGSIGAENFRVGGIMETGNAALDNVLVVMPLEEAMDLAVTGGGVTEIAVFLDSAESTDDVLPSIREIAEGEGLEVVSWRELLSFLVDMIGLAEIFKYIPLAILIGVSGLGILNTVLMSVTERTREFGVMMALGTGPGRLAGLILIETMVETIMGLALGSLTGTAFLLYLGETGIDLSRWARGIKTIPFHPTVIYPIIVPESFTVALATVVASAFLATLYPAMRIGRLSPSEALRSA